MKNRYLGLTLVFLVGIAASVHAEIKIAAQCRIKNRPPGRCGWCALETLARHHQLKNLYNVVDSHPYPCCPESLESCLHEAKIAYQIQYAGDRRVTILEDAVRKGRGAAVGFRELYPGKGGHIVTLIDYTAAGVKVIDSNDQDGRTREMTLERFLYWWDGFALVLDPGMANSAETEDLREVSAATSSIPESRAAPRRVLQTSTASRAR